MSDDIEPLEIKAEHTYLPVLQDVEVTERDRPLIWVKRRVRVDLRPEVRSSASGFSATSGSIEHSLHTTWEGMISRCYNPSDSSYKNYGAIGVFVDARWRSVEMFVQDVMKIPNWQNKEMDVGKYQIDKDYYGSNCYSHDTCVWLHISENAIYRTGVYPIALVSPNDEVTYHLNAQGAADHMKVSEKQVRNMLARRNTKMGRDGWRALYIDAKEYVLRRAFVSTFPQPLLVTDIDDRVSHV